MFDRDENLKPQGVSAGEGALRASKNLKPKGPPSQNPPRRRPNEEVRPREHLTEEEVECLMGAARKLGRHGKRDAAMILIAFRHGMRVSELVALRWEQSDLKKGQLSVRRRKGGNPSTHILHGKQLRALRYLKRAYPDTDYVFVSERKTPVSDSSFRKIVARAGIHADIPFAVHPHMLRHATGYKLANDGRDSRVIQDYLGHRNIQSTVRYTKLAPGRFTDLWDD